MGKYLQNKSDVELGDMAKDIRILNDTAVWPDSKIPVWVQEVCDEDKIPQNQKIKFAIMSVEDEVMKRFVSSLNKNKI